MSLPAGERWRVGASVIFLFQEHPPAERLARAAASGFSEIELWADGSDPGLPLELERLGLRPSMLATPGLVGDYYGGERGYATEPGGRERLLAALERDLELARRLRAPRMVVLAGRRAADSDGRAELDRLVEALRAGASLAERAGVKLVLEPLNTIDNPGYAAGDLETALGVLQRVGSPAVRLLFDFYHLGLSEPDLLAALERAAPYVDHVQLADLPGRHEPGTGQFDFERLLPAVDRLTPLASVALEYRPVAGTEVGLAALPPRIRRLLTRRAAPGSAALLDG